MIRIVLERFLVVGFLEYSLKVILCVSPSCRENTHLMFSLIFKCFVTSYPKIGYFFLALTAFFNRFGRQNRWYVIYHRKCNFMKILKMQILSLLNVNSKFYMILTFLFIAASERFAIS